MIETCREHSKNVKRWRDGTMALRWCAAGMLEADHQFRRVNGRYHVPSLAARTIAALLALRDQVIALAHACVLIGMFTRTVRAGHSSTETSGPASL